LDILAFIFGLIGGLALIGLAALSTSSLASQYPILANFSSASSLLYVLGAIALIFGIFSLVIAIGFLGGKGWAWTLGIVVGVINIVVSIVEAVIGLSSNIVGIIFQIIILYYLTRPHVKAFFGKGPVMGSVPPPMMSSMPMGSSSTMSSMGIACKNCGASIPAGATRCPSCGANL
jgi:hypothetical protein